MLKPEVSVPVTVTTAALVFGLFSGLTLPAADTRAATPNDPKLRAGERQAFYLSLAAAAGVGALSRDPWPFVAGATTAVILVWIERINIATDPVTDRVNLSTTLGQGASLSERFNSVLPQG